MALTGFPSGVSSFGVPQVGGAPFKPYATYYFVDANNFMQSSSDGNTGLSPDNALSTMARAFELLLANASHGRGGSGSVISFIGNITEQLTTPAGVFDVTVIGCGNSPRNADAFSGNSGYTAATWKAPSSATAATPLCRVIQQGWTFSNFLVAPPADAAGLEFVRNAAASTSERDGGWGTVSGCRFAAGQNHIGISAAGFTENVFGLTINNNTFNGSTAASIMAPANVAGWRHQITDNVFSGNESHIVAGFTQATIARNEMGLFTTSSIDLTGGANNMVGIGNLLSGTYDNGGGYTGSGTDTWSGNYDNATGLVFGEPTA